jgi:hypothetical protein
MHFFQDMIAIYECATVSSARVGLTGHAEDAPCRAAIGPDPGDRNQLTKPCHVTVLRISRVCGQPTRGRAYEYMMWLACGVVSFLAVAATDGRTAGGLQCTLWGLWDRSEREALTATIRAFVCIMYMCLGSSTPPCYHLQCTEYLCCYKSRTEMANTISSWSMKQGSCMHPRLAGQPS